MKLVLRSALLVATTVLLAACGTGGGDADGSGSDGPPAAPTNVRAQPGPGYVTVTWDDGADDETGFVIYRVDGTTVASLRTQAEEMAGEVGPDAERFVDTGVELGTSTSYRVAAVNEHGESQATSAPEAVTVQPGVDLLVGTNDRRYDDGVGTVFIAYLVLPEEVMLDESLVFEGTISGPEGWNGGALYEFSVPVDHFSRQEDGYEFLSESSIDVVAGTYDLTVTIGSDVYTASYTLADAGYRLGPPTNIVITERSSARVAVAWDQPAATQATFVSLWRGDYEEFVAGYVITTETTAAFEDLTLEDGSYQVEVAPVNTDVSTYPVKVDPFGISYETRTFAIGDAVAESCTDPTDVVTIPDAALEQAVRDSIDEPAGDLTCEAMALVTELHVDEMGIASLEGLQYAANLQELNANGNDIIDLGPLADLEELAWLELNENQIDDLTPLQGLTNLSGLALCCESNGYSDISPILGLTRLEMLDLSQHPVTDPSFLADFTELRELWLEETDITDVTFVASLPNLEILHVGRNPITDITPIHDHVQLLELHLPDLGLVDADIDFLASFTDLEELDLTFNLLTDVSPLVANPGLGAGDLLQLDFNFLDLSEGSEAMNDVQELIDRGATVEYEPQQEP